MANEKVVVVPDMVRIHLIPKVASAGIHKAFHMERRARLDTLDEDGEEFRVVVVRHPLDRIVSNWAYFCQGPATELNAQPQVRKLGYTDNMEFDHFLDVISEQHWRNNHTRMQVNFLGHHKIDRMIRLVDLAEEWYRLRRRFPFMQVMREIPRIHETKHAPWQHYYTEETRKRAETAFAPDMDLYETTQGTMQ